METRAKRETDSDSTKRNENLKCWNAGSNPLCLRIELSDGTQFILPYGYFEGAKFIREAETEILHLQFKTNEFVVKGSCLDEMFTAFQEFSVEWMKPCPRRFEPLSKENAFIQQIEIAESAED
jgi:hypothetical protein